MTKTITPTQAKVVKGGLGGGAAIAAILAAVFTVEGGYVNNPADPGGETNMGITKRVAVAHGYTGPMAILPKQTAADIFTKSYIDKPGFRPMVELEPSVAEELVDTAVNMGPPRPSRWFQQTLVQQGFPIVVDGMVGPATILAYRNFQRKAGRVRSCIVTLDALDARQSAEYDRLVRVNPALKQFRKGWQRNRIGNVDRMKCGRDIL